MTRGKPAVAIRTRPHPHAGLTSGDEDMPRLLPHPLAHRCTHLLNEWVNE